MAASSEGRDGGDRRRKFGRDSTGVSRCVTLPISW